MGTGLLRLAEDLAFGQNGQAELGKNEDLGPLLPGAPHGAERYVGVALGIGHPDHRGCRSGALGRIDLDPQFQGTGPGASPS